MRSVQEKLIVLLVFMMVVLISFSQITSAQENAVVKKPSMEEFLGELEKENLEWLVVELMANLLDTTTDDILDNPEKGIAIVNAVEIKGNDALAVSTLQTLSVAAETFTTAPENKGKYPKKIEDLTEDKEPYLLKRYCGETIYGFKYDCDFSAEEYRFVATPEVVGETGSGVFVITTGGVFLEN